MLNLYYLISNTSECFITLFWRKSFSVSEKAVVTSGEYFMMFYYCSMFLGGILFAMKYAAGFLVYFLSLMKGQADFFPFLV